MQPFTYVPGSSPAASEDAIDISALVFTAIAAAAGGLALTIGATLLIAWMIRDSLAPLLGVA